MRPSGSSSRTARPSSCSGSTVPAWATTRCARRSATRSTALHAPYLPRLVEGGKIVIEDRIEIKGHLMHFQAHLVPDLGEGGELKGFYAMTFDVTALKLAEERMSLLARVDTLTELPNRRQFEERLAEAMACRPPHPPAHRADVPRHRPLQGPSTIRWATTAATWCCRSSRAACARACAPPTPSRASRGDEFVIVLEGLNVGQEAEGVAQKIIDAMTPPVRVQGRMLDVTTSIGIVVSGADEPDGADADRPAPTTRSTARARGAQPVGGVDAYPFAARPCRLLNFSAQTLCRGGRILIPFVAVRFLVGDDDARVAVRRKLCSRSPSSRIRSAEHPLRPIRCCVNEALLRLNGPFRRHLLGSRPSIHRSGKQAPARHADSGVLLGLQRAPVGRADSLHNLLYRWFIGLAIDDEVWGPL